MTEDSEAASVLSLSSAEFGPSLASVWVGVGCVRGSSSSGEWKWDRKMKSPWEDHVSKLCSLSVRS